MAIRRKVILLLEVLLAMPMEPPRFYLITPPISNTAPYPELSGELMAGCGGTCLLVRTAAYCDAENEIIFRRLAVPLQERGIVADDPQFCVRVHADGVHVNGEGPQLEQALRSLKPGLIVGAGGLRTRHAAMVAGEAGVDYVMFAEGAEQQATLVEQIAWWAEIFTVPCVGYAHDLDSIGDLVCAGADFIALGGAVFFDPRGPRSGVARGRCACHASAGSGTVMAGPRNLRKCFRVALMAAWAILAGACLFLPARAGAGEPRPAGNPTGEQGETAAESLPVPARLGGAPDIAFGAYQRGYYLTAMREAVKRVNADPNDGPAMTLIGELYAQGLGVRCDPTEAAHWYKLAADRSNPQATFALAMAKLNGEGVPKDRSGAAQLLEKAAVQDHPGALYNLGVLAIENDGVTKNFEKAAELFKRAADLGNSDGGYALGLLYKNGSGVEKSEQEAASWIGRAAKDGNVPAEVEYAIMLFNGAGIEKNETAAAKLFLKAAVSNNPVAQNRAARILAAGRGLPKDMVEAMKWHLLAKAAGIKDSWLDGELAKLSPQEKIAVETNLRHYMGN
jgi:uncharacterized protein